MECLACRDNLSAYLDDELNSGEQAQVEQHLGQCARCNVEYLSLSESFRLVNGVLEEIPLAPEVWQRVRASIVAPVRSERKKWWESFGALFQTPRRAWATASLGVILAAGSMLMILRSNQVQNPELEALRGRMNTILEQMEQREREPHNFLNASEDEYNFNPFAPQHISIEVNPFRLEPKTLFLNSKERSGLRDLQMEVTPASDRR